MKYYSCTSMDNFISGYIERGGQAYCIDDGVLTSGDWILFDNRGKLKFCIIKEVYINDWSSAQTIRRYKKLPKKYKELLSNM